MQTSPQRRQYYDDPYELSSKHGDVSAVPQNLLAARSSVIQGMSAIGWTGRTVPLGLDHRNPYQTGIDSDE
jgi:hypothetical protein